MKYRNKLNWFLSGIMVLWTPHCLAQAVYDQTGTAYAAPADAASQQTQAADLLGKRGQQKVDQFTGSFSYSIPIACAPGRNGSEPKLALAYASAEDLGWCGMGWKLEIGSIERNTREGIPIAYSTGATPAPLDQYDDTKGFMLNLFGKGCKLFSVATNGTVVEYRAEVDTDFLRCFLDTGNNNWTVYDKSGNVYYFGETASSRVTNSKAGWGGYSGTFHWALDQIVTATGDWTTVAYTNYISPNTALPEQTLYPTQIAYNGHTNYNGYTASVVGPDKIIFQTELRTNDWRFSFRSGFRTEQGRRLTNILCQVGSQNVASYRLKYGISPATARSLLTNVVLYGYDVNNNATALLTNTFAYQGNPNGVSFGSSILWTNLVLNTPPGPSSGSDEPEISQVNYTGGFSYTVADLVDMDGDGLPDRVSYDNTATPNQYQVQKNLGMQSSSRGSFGSRYAFGPTSTSGGLAATASNPLPPGGGYAQLNTPYGRIRDINGDGLPDRVMDYWAALNSVDNNATIYTPYTNYDIQLNTGQGFSAMTYWPVSAGPLQPNDHNSALYYCVESGGVNVGLFDINGDGLPDRVMSDYYNLGPMTNFMVQFNTGTNFNQPIVFGPYHSQNWNGSSGQSTPYQWAGIETPEAHMIDINGDGLPDRLMYPMDPSNAGHELPHPTSYYAVEYDDGYSFESTNTSTLVPGAADKWPGVVSPTTSTIIYNGVTFYGDAILDPPFGGLYDVNGDGLPDRVMIDPSTWGSPNTQWLVYLNNGHGFNTTPIVVTGINNQGQYLSSSWPEWSPQGSESGYGAITTLIDINGDGLLDRVMTVYDTGNGMANSTSNYFLVQLNTGPFPDLLTNINNGIGGNLGISYNPSTFYDNRVDTTNPNSVSHMPFPKYVTAAVTASDGINPPQTMTYSYGGGFFDGVRREFHGFAVVTNTDPTLRSTVTYFHTGGGRNYAALGEYQDTNSTTGAGNFAKAGMAYRVETYGNDNNLYHVTVNQVNQTSLGNARYFPFTALTFECDYPGGGTPKVTATQFTYDTMGNVTNKIEYGQVTGFNPASVGTFSFSDAIPADTRNYNTHFTTIGSYIVDHPDKATLTDVNNNVFKETDYSYNSPAGTLATNLTLISTGYYATNSYVNYTTYGLVGTTTDPVGVQTTITYDSTYNTYPATSTVGSLTTTTSYDPRSGQLALSTDPAGLTVSNSFDVFQRPTESDKIPIGGGSAIWMKKYAYPVLQPIFNGLATNYVDEQENDGVGGVESRTYIDGFGRPVQTITQGENGNYRVVSTAYDGRGNAFLTTWPTFGTSITFNKPTSQTAAWTGYDADGRVVTNRLVTASFSNGAFSSAAILAGDTGSPLAAKTWSYVNGTDPWWIICTDEDGQIRRYGLDAFGRTNQIQEVDGSSTYTSTLNYDLADNLTNLVNANSENIYWAFNDAGGMVAMADPYLGQWTYQRDVAGRLRVQTDARGDVVTNSYIDPATGQQDPMGRVHIKAVFNSVAACNANTPASTATYTYDVNSIDNGTYPVYEGLLYMVTDSEGWEKNGYDTRGRLIINTRHLNINNQNYTTTYTYNDGDKVTSTSYPNSGPTINYSYWTGGSLKQVANNSSFSGNIYYSVAAGNYDQFGHVTSFADGNGVTTTRNYYSNSKRLQSITAGSVFNRTYTYSAGDDILSLSGTGMSSTAITYDDLHRILSYTGLSGSYSYDAVGSMTANIETGTAITYGYGSERKQAVKSAFGYNYLYDLCGNMIVRHGGTTGSQAMSYDAENQLKVFSQVGTVVVEYGYAEDGTRLWKRVDQDPTQVQVWIGNIYEEKGGKVLFHVFAGDQQVCTFEAASPLDGGGNSSAVGYYYHEDSLNSSSALSSSSGSQQEVDVYYPFGRAVTGTLQASFQVSRRFTGQVFDMESGLYYYNARYYDPELGRFIQPDTEIPDLSNPQSYNRYSYCVNDPLCYTDPSGHAEQTTVWEDLGTIAGSWFAADPSQPISSANNTYISQRTALLGPTENIMPAMVKQSVEMVGKTGEAVTEQYMGGKVLVAGGAVIGGVVKAAKAGEAAVAAGKVEAAVAEVGKSFTQAQKRAILDANRLKNGGELRSDLSGEKLIPAQKSVKGVTPAANEAQVDHVIPRSKGGPNATENAQVLSRQENRAKSDKLPNQ